MALSQIQCLDDHHVNWRVSESKPEFFYSEDQRLALEALITKGRDAFTDYTRENNIRQFLSEPELERIAHIVEAYRPGHEHHLKLDMPSPGNTTPGLGNTTPGLGNTTPGLGNITPGSAEDADGPLSLQYWPDRSEASVAELDLGWPEANSYRGVTRVTVYTQPPTDGHTHIKEVVRKSIASAQRVIAVVMDVFTDVDIFRDLLDASYKRKVPVYIIIDQAAVPCFLSMCGRADMHRGHLKNLRVRCCGGVEFFSRTAQKVRGSLSQKFLLADGDRAISGSYSFTWSSSRLDRNLITVITGQAVETFDYQFRDLFLLSRGVSLHKVPMEDEPIPDPLPQMAPAPVPAAIARKLVNPKYALVSTGTHPSQASSEQNPSKQTPPGLKILKGRLKNVVEEPPIHPGLANLEKAYLIPYLPTWPEPDPPSDVIGFINIRDEKRAHQVHLQRSERFQVSQAVRFTSPLTAPAAAETPASNQDVNKAGTAENPSGKKCKDTSAPVSPTKKQPKKQTQTAVCNDEMDGTDSRGLPQQQNAPVGQDTTKPNTTQHTSPTSQPSVTADSQPTDNAKQTPEDAQTAAPPVPKPRTLQIIVDPVHSEQPGQPQVTLIKIDQSDEEEEEELKPRHSILTLKDDGPDSGSNGDGSQDSTKVICDRAANDDPSSTSTASEEEFYDCDQPETRDQMIQRVTTGSGHGQRPGDGINMMARFSQSMLDLREPSKTDDSTDLIRQSQQLRRQGHSSPHRHIGQLFQTSKSPGRDGRLRGNKVVLAKPGSFHRPSRAVGPVIGGHRYWQGQTLQPDSSRTPGETRSSRSPRRHSPGIRKTGHAMPQPPANPTGLLGVSFSKVNNLKHLRAKGGSPHKKTSQSNMPTR